MSSNVPDYKRIDYRGFVFVVHEDHGLLLLHCTRKPKKGPHYQLPGGHVDNHEFETTVKNNGKASRGKILLEACKLGAARELYEETGIDVRKQLHRLDPAAILPSHSDNKLGCMLKNKCYFHLIVNDDDFFSPLSSSDGNLVASNNSDSPKTEKLMLKLSEEHSGFIFECDPHESIKKLKQHSGGAGSMALEMSMKNSAIENSNPNAPSDWEGETIQLETQYAYAEDLAPLPKRESIWSCFC